MIIATVSLDCTCRCARSTNCAPGLRIAQTIVRHAIARILTLPLIRASVEPIPLSPLDHTTRETQQKEQPATPPPVLLLPSEVSPWLPHVALEPPRS
eukprot:3911611-Prymnesium_polylepis.2